MDRRHLVGDVGAGVGGADDQHRPVLQLVRSAVLAGVQLPDRGGELGGEVRNVRRPAERAGRHHDVVAADRPPSSSVHDVAAARPRLEPLDPDADPDREPESVA